MNRKKRKSNVGTMVLKEVLIFCIYIAVFFGIMLLVRNFALQRTLVNGISMENTLHDGDILLLDKISYKRGDPQRFDIIAFEQSSSVYYIKRIIGLPGEKVRIDDKGNIYINGQLLEESYGNEVIKGSMDEITVGQSQYFVLGDNRNNSKDSRDPSVQCIAKDKILGRAFIRVWPIGNIGKITQ